MVDADRDDLVLGIVGSGLMGRGIAQIAALAGVRVLLCDARADAAAEARLALGETFAMLAGKGRLAATAADDALARIAAVATMADLAPCDIVVEAIVENLEAKRSLFKHLEEVVRDDCLLASNTSSLSITAIAAACRLPERFGGFHFFSPVPLMKVVEVIDGVRGAAWVGECLTALARRMGHTPVRAQDTPGFIVNHAGRAYLTEALRIVGEGICAFHDVDRIMRAAAGFRLGPFELLDLTGLDVSHPVMESIYEQYYQEPRYRPSPIARQRLAAGLLGRKSGHGFYAYPDGRQQWPEPPPVPAAVAANVWISAGHEAARAWLVARLAGTAVRVDAGERPQAGSVCIVFPVGADVTDTALAEDLDPAVTLGIDPLCCGAHATLMTTPVTRAASRDAIWAALAAGASSVSVVHDSPGFVAQRMLATIVNVACDIAQQRIATPEDIDRAVTLGLGYPKGPLAWGDAIGAATILRILDGLHAFYRDPRYRPSPWLIRRARLGVSLLTPEA